MGIRQTPVCNSFNPHGKSESYLRWRLQSRFVLPPEEPGGFSCLATRMICICCFKSQLSFVCYSGRPPASVRATSLFSLIPELTRRRDDTHFQQKGRRPWNVGAGLLGDRAYILRTSLTACGIPVVQAGIETVDGGPGLYNAPRQLVLVSTATATKSQISDLTSAKSPRHLVA